MKARETTRDIDPFNRWAHILSCVKDIWRELGEKALLTLFNDLSVSLRLINSHVIRARKYVNRFIS